MKCATCAVDDEAVADGGDDAAKQALLHPHRDGASVAFPPGQISVPWAGCGARRGGRRTRSESGGVSPPNDDADLDLAFKLDADLGGVAHGPGPGYTKIGGSEGNFATCGRGAQATAGKRASLGEQRWSSLKETSVHVQTSGKRANGGASIVVQPAADKAKVIGKEVGTHPAVA